MPVLKVRDPNTGLYVPLMAGNNETNEVTISTAQPTDGSELWIDTDEPSGSASDYVLRVGDQMSGPLLQAADPVDPLGSATKQYVDNGSRVAVPALSGWADYGGAYGTVWATRAGSVITLEGMYKRLSDLTVALTTSYDVAQLPGNWGPQRDLIFPILHSLSTDAWGIAGRMKVTSSGLLSMTTYKAGTIPTSGGWVALNGISYRAPGVPQ